MFFSISAFFLQQSGKFQVFILKIHRKLAEYKQKKRQKMKTLRKIAGLWLICSLTSVLQAQSTDCTFRKTFQKKDGMYLNVTNKFGDISVLSSEEDSITICATVTIKQNNKELSEKSIGLIKIAVNKLADTISVKTGFDEKFFSAPYRNGRTGFSVDYVINLPENSNLTIINSFGDVILDEFSGIIDVKISNGDFSAEKLSRGNTKPVSSLSFEHGKAVIEEANWLSISAKSCQSVIVEKARALLLNTEFSKLTLDDISSIVCDSRSDVYEINSVRNFIGISTLSEFRIDNLSVQLQAKTDFGSMTLTDVQKDFSLIDISSSKTPVYLEFQGGASYKVDMTLINSLLDFPFEENRLVNKTTTGNTTIISGTAGNNKDSKSLLKVKLDLGKLEIR